MKKRFAILLSLVMVLTAAIVPVSAGTDAKLSHKANYLALGDSISSGFDGEATFSFGKGNKNYYLGYYGHDVSFSNEGNISYTNILNKKFVEATGGQGEYSYNATGSALRLRDFTTMLGLTEHDGYTGGDEVLKMNGVDASFTDSFANFKKDRAIIDEAIENADIITINYGSNELFTYIIESVLNGKIKDGFQEKQNESIKSFAHSWNLAMEYITEKNPDATVVFVGVYNPADRFVKANVAALLPYLAKESIKDYYSTGVNRINEFIKTGKTSIKGMEENLYPVNNTDNLFFIDTQYVPDNNYLAADKAHPSAKGTKWMADELIDLLTDEDNCSHCSQEFVGKKVATPFVKGYTGDIVCNICGKTVVSGKEIPTVKSSVKYATVPCKVKQSFKVTSNMNIAKGDSVSKVTTSSSKIATVKGTTVKAGKKKGTATVTVTMKSGQKYSFKVKVQKSAVKCSKLSTKVASKVTLKKGKKLSIGASKAPFTCKYKITYKSSKKSVATVSKNGTITAKKKGTAKIKVYCKGKKKTITVTVK